MYLTDLTFIEDGNKDYVTDEGLINFDKRRKISTVIREIQQYQQTPYCLEAVPWLQDMLNNVEYWEENETYVRSLPTLNWKQPRRSSLVPTFRPLLNVWNPRICYRRRRRRLQPRRYLPRPRIFLRRRQKTGRRY